MTTYDLLFTAAWALAILLCLLSMSRRLADQVRRASLHNQAAYERRASRLESEILGRVSALEAQGHAQREALLEKLQNIQEDLQASRPAQDQRMEQALAAWGQPFELRLRGQVEEAAARPGEAHRAEQRAKIDRLQNDLGFIKNRISAYLGGGAGLTWLVDETPIYINTDDFGCPSNFLNGGRYEEEYFQVLASFRRPGSVFLDIGANLGVFSLRLAPMMRQGKVHAFEPNARIHELFSRSVHLNGYKHLIEVHRFGVSDRDAEMVLAVPEGHAGGANVVEASSAIEGESISVRRIDDLLANLDRFDLAKIDVEGHELHALRGMRTLLGRSPEAVILFEKLNARSGIESDLLAFFQEFGMAIHRIDGVDLIPVDRAAFEQAEAYFLAARPATIGADARRNFFELYPADLYAIRSRSTDSSLLADDAMPAESVIFHGPYWFLPRGSYRVSIDGDVREAFRLVVAEKFGYPVAEFHVTQAQRSFEFVVSNDLTQFELVGRSIGEKAEFELRSVRLTRLG